MKRRTFAAILFSLLISCSWFNSASAAVTTQTFTLHPGWNTVFLEVEPQSTAPAEVFSESTFDPSTGINDLLSVWMWNPRTGTVEFIQNPALLVPEGPQWMVYYPDNSDNAILTNLFAIHGETPYLIHLDGTVDVVWTVTGQPTVPCIDWKANSFNFVGFHLEEGNEPFFDDFFSTSLAHSGQEIYILDNSGVWKPVDDPGTLENEALTTVMRSGEAFWIYCKGSSEFTGPLSVQLEQGTGLHYGTTLVEQDLRVLNNAALDKTVSLTVSSGDVNLHYWLFDPQNNVAEWVDLATTPLALTIAAGEMQKLRLGVRRAGLTAGTSYEANVEVTDGNGMMILLPASVTGIDYAGLWVGYATINKVSEPANVSDPDTPVKTGSEFSFRLILHADNSGPVRLLSQVIQMWDSGGGGFVLFTDDALIPNYSPVVLRDGQPVGRRISSPAFGFSGPKDMNGNFQIGSSLSLALVLPQADPTNPFRHKYHPDHREPEQSYEVTRDILLEFRDHDDEGKPITGVPVLSWGSANVGGIYKETIWGLHRDQIKIKGTFLLHKVCNVGTLTQ